MGRLIFTVITLRHTTMKILSSIIGVCLIANSTAAMIPKKMVTAVSNASEEEKVAGTTTTVTISVGSHGSAGTSCGPVVYVGDSTGGMYRVKFNAMSVSGTYQSSVTTDKAFDPSVFDVSISGQCGDGLLINAISINGYYYNLVSTTNGFSRAFWVD